MTEKTDPFEIGRDDYLAGLLMNENPFPEGSVDATEWECGWMSMEEEEDD